LFGPPHQAVTPVIDGRHGLIAETIQVRES
jgi:hypothetical protein